MPKTAGPPQTAPRVFKGAVIWTALHTSPAATRMCSTSTAAMASDGSAPIGAIPTVSGMTMALSRFPLPQLPSLLAPLYAGLSFA